LFEAVGLFDESMRQAEDLDWYARVSQAGHRLVKLPEQVLELMRHDTNLTGDRSGKRKGVFDAVRQSVARKRAGGSGS
jgi:hypothetical protein